MSDLSPDFSLVAALIADPTRAALLAQLWDGAARTAGELALNAGISPQTASNHLGKLLRGGLLALEVQGRHRYYRLTNRDVAQALEALSALAGSPELSKNAVPKIPLELRFARTCYDHLAGELGVALTAALLERGFLLEQAQDFVLTEAGEGWFCGFGIQVKALRRSRRHFARRCLDWSERRAHLGGALGAALLEQLCALGWVVSVGGSRAVRLTVSGKLGLEYELGLRGV